MPSNLCLEICTFIIHPCRWASCPQILTWPFLLIFSLPVSSRMLSEKICFYPSKLTTSPSCRLSIPCPFIVSFMEFTIWIYNLSYSDNLFAGLFSVSAFTSKQIVLSLSYSVACSRNSMIIYININIWLKAWNIFLVKNVFVPLKQVCRQT